MHTVRRVDGTSAAYDSCHCGTWVVASRGVRVETCKKEGVECFERKILNCYVKGVFEDGWWLIFVVVATVGVLHAASACVWEASDAISAIHRESGSIGLSAVRVTSRRKGLEGMGMRKLATPWEVKRLPAISGCLVRQTSGGETDGRVAAYAVGIIVVHTVGTATRNGREIARTALELREATDRPA